MSILFWLLIGLAIYFVIVSHVEKDAVRSKKERADYYARYLAELLRGAK